MAALSCATCLKTIRGNAGREEYQDDGTLKVWCRACCRLFDKVTTGALAGPSE